jgi:hypothetical protein
MVNHVGIVYTWMWWHLGLGSLLDTPQIVLASSMTVLIA